MNDSIFDLQYSHSVPPLSRAAQCGDLKKIKKLLMEGFRPQSPDNRGWTAIHYCVFANRLNVLKFFLKQNLYDKICLVNLMTWENVSPLHIAMKTPKPCLKMIKTLLKAGANVQQSTNTNLTPLHLACMKKNSLPLVKLLVEFGADVNAQETLGMCTPLHIAICEHCDLDVIQYLLDRSDLNLSLENTYGRTAFFEACNSNSVKLVEMFLKKNRQLIQIHGGLSPLSYAGVVGNLEMVQLLIKSGAQVNVTCNAIIPCTSSKDLIIFEGAMFMPVHSSLTNVDVFKHLLKLSDSQLLLQLETRSCSFPIFVLMNGGEKFYKELVLSDLPEELRKINCSTLARYMHVYSNEVNVTDKIPTVLKYNFNLLPEDILRHMTELQVRDFSSFCETVSLLTQMGISPHFEYKNQVVGFLEMLTEKCGKEWVSNIKSNCDSLLQVVSLKQYCRLQVRRLIQSLVKNEFLAFEMLSKLGLPDLVKQYLLFEII